jgi:hypothetical protein
MHEGRDELPETPRIDEIEVELPIVDGRVIRNDQAASMEAPIGDAHLIDQPRPGEFPVKV